MTTPLQPAVLIGLIGHGIQGSRTPPMHEQEGAEQGLRYIYRSIDIEKLRLGVDALPELLAAAERMGFNGLNITHPFKQAVIPLLTELSDDARALGAVNTVLLKDGKRMGHNTDWFGYYESFRRGLPDAKTRRVVQLGAGGAGCAIGHAALKLGFEQLAVFDVEKAKAEQMVKSLNDRFGGKRAVVGTDLKEALAVADGLIHATPTGMKAHPGTAVPKDLLDPHLWVSEIVYLPLETELLKIAKEKGCRTMNGEGMTVYQAAEAFRLFTGREASADRMRQHFRSL